MDDCCPLKTTWGRRALSARGHLGRDLHSFLIMEYDLLLSEDAERRMVEFMTQNLKRTL